MLALEPIGYVRSTRMATEPDSWGGVESRIVLTDEMEPDALLGIEEFSHAEIIYQFHLARRENVVRGARHPRDDPRWPRVGILAQRGRDRPNLLGCSIVRIIAREGPVLRVAELDAIDGTPVLDIKPVMQEFLPRAAVRQPPWSHEVMRHYWDHPS